MTSMTWFAITWLSNKRWSRSKKSVTLCQMFSHNRALTDCLYHLLVLISFPVTGAASVDQNLHVQLVKTAVHFQWKEVLMIRSGGNSRNSSIWTFLISSPSWICTLLCKTRELMWEIASIDLCTPWQSVELGGPLRVNEASSNPIRPPNIEVHNRQTLLWRDKWLCREDPSKWIEKTNWITLRYSNV